MNEVTVLLCKLNELGFSGLIEHPAVSYCVLGLVYGCFSFAHGFRMSPFDSGNWTLSVHYPQQPALSAELHGIGPRAPCSPLLHPKGFQVTPGLFSFLFSYFSFFLLTPLSFSPNSKRSNRRQRNCIARRGKSCGGLLVTCTPDPEEAGPFTDQGSLPVCD